MRKLTCTHTNTHSHTLTLFSLAHTHTHPHTLSLTHKLSHCSVLFLFRSSSTETSLLLMKNLEQWKSEEGPFYYVLFFNWKKSTAAFLGFVQEKSNTNVAFNKVIFKWHKFGWNLFDKHIQCYIILHFKTWQREFHLEGKVWWRFAQICSPLQTVYQLVTFQLIT